MYGYLVKIADELKTLRAESEQLICASEYSQKAWHEGGMWRGPNVLPGASASSKPGLDASRKPSTLDGGSNNIHGNDGGGNGDGNGGGGRGGGAANNPCSGGPALVPRVPVSLTDLFLDIVSEFICRLSVVIPPPYSFECAVRWGARPAPPLAPPRPASSLSLIPNNDTIRAAVRFYHISTDDAFTPPKPSRASPAWVPRSRTGGG
jgi:hypothetical protein